MTPNELFGYAGMASSVIAGLVLARGAWQLNTAKVWKGEAEAQKQRADRLQEDLTEIKDRLTRIEAENARLIQLLTALDPAHIAALRN